MEKEKPYEKLFQTNSPTVLTTVIILLTAAVLLACGPATQAAPGEQPGSKPAQERSTPEPTNTPEPTPPPTDIVTINPDGTTNEIVQWVPQKSPPTYPGIDSILEHLVKEAEDETGSGSGLREQQPLKTPSWP